MDLRQVARIIETVCGYGIDVPIVVCGASLSGSAQKIICSLTTE